MTTTASPSSTLVPRFDSWDPTPHSYHIVPVGDIQLGDMVLGGTHQVDGIGRADQRGQAAVRLDLYYVAGRSDELSARLILPLDHDLEIKRYTVDAGHRWAWVQLRLEAAEYRTADGERGLVPRLPGLVPDFGANTEVCETGEDDGTTMCDACAPSWAVDHVVVRG